MHYIERELPVEWITEPERPHRLQIDAEELHRLADDIAANGLHQRPGVRETENKQRFALIYGHRRLLAFRVLGRPEIPVKVYPAGTDELQVRMAENELRADLNPIEQAHICREFIERGDPVTAIARYWRRSDGWVRGRLALLELPADVQEAMADGVLTPAVAHELARVDNDRYRVSLIAEAANHGCSERTAAAWAAHYLADRERIITNTMTIEQLAARRESFVVKAICEICQQEHDLTRTRALRCCLPCLEAVAAALRQPTSS